MTQSPSQSECSGWVTSSKLHHLRSHDYLNSPSLSGCQVLEKINTAFWKKQHTRQLERFRHFWDSLKRVLRKLSSNCRAKLSKAPCLKRSFNCKDLKFGYRTKIWTQIIQIFMCPSRSNRTILSYFWEEDNFIFKLVLDWFGCIQIWAAKLLIKNVLDSSFEFLSFLLNIIMRR